MTDRRRVARPSLLCAAMMLLASAGPVFTVTDGVDGAPVFARTAPGESAGSTGDDSPGPGASDDTATRTTKRPARICLEAPIILTQLPASPAGTSEVGRCDGMLRAEYGAGGRIVRLDPDGALRVLTADFASACGADVSFDGRKILFAAQKSAGDDWNVWEMYADGSEPRQITRGLGNCRSPAYQATLYTIVSTEPWRQIMFVSDAAAALNEQGCAPASSLYSCKLDGSARRRLTFNLGGEFDPFLMSDGRVLLSSWRRSPREAHGPGQVALFGVNTDGTDCALFSGGQQSRIRHMACETSGGLVVFVAADEVGWAGGGRLACVSIRRPHGPERVLTDREDGVYHSPAPLPDGTVLVSRRSVDEAGTYELCKFDPHNSSFQSVFDDPNFHEVHARLLVPRPQPDGRSSVVNEKYATGKLYCLNSYMTEPELQGHFKPGLIKSVRVIEGIPGSVGARMAEGRTAVGKRLLGLAPVEEDGSFQIEIPADVPIQLQALDADGLALRTCGWIWVKHHEPRGCIGCHEDPELTPENRFVTALRKPAVALTLPPSRRRMVDFQRDVMPVISAKCAGCHDGKRHGLDLSGNEVKGRDRAHAALCAQDAGLIRPGEARNSPLVWRLMGRRTSRPWDAGHDEGGTVGRCPPEGAEPLSEDERMRFIEWIDLGAAE